MRSRSSSIQSSKPFPSLAIHPTRKPPRYRLRTSSSLAADAAERRPCSHSLLSVFRPDSNSATSTLYVWHGSKPIVLWSPTTNLGKRLLRLDLVTLKLPSDRSCERSSQSRSAITSRDCDRAEQAR